MVITNNNLAVHFEKIIDSLIDNQVFFVISMASLFFERRLLFGQKKAKNELKRSARKICCHKSAETPNERVSSIQFRVAKTLRSVCCLRLLTIVSILCLPSVSSHSPFPILPFTTSPFPITLAVSRFLGVALGLGLGVRVRIRVRLKISS